MASSAQPESVLHLDHEKIMETINALPPLPPSVTRLNQLFADPDYEFKDVVRAVELDPSLSGKLMHLANSASYGPGKVSSIGEAVVRLGGSTIRATAMAECVRPPVDLDMSTFGLSPSTYWRHSAAVVCFSEELMAQRVASFGTEFGLAAILHDFGKVVLAGHLTAEHVYFLHQEDPDLSASELEQAILSLNHAEVSAAVAQAWELPEHVVKAIQYHHSPDIIDTTLCHGLNIANHLAWQLEGNEYCFENEAARRTTSMEALGITTEKLATIATAGAQRVEEALEAYS